MKVILYTTSDCMFSKQEKEYLASKNIPFEEKNVQTNRDFLQEMLNVSNNFAGTPVTKIDKDDGQSVVLKGFTQSEFDNVFASNVQAANSTMPVPPAPTDQPVQDQPAPIPQPDPVAPDPVVPNVPDPTPLPPVEQPVEIPPFESPTTPPAAETPANPEPLPPTPADDSTTEMHSTIPVDPALSNDPVVPTPQPDPVTPDPVTPDPVVPETPMPEMPPVETPPSVETPPAPEQPAVNQDQQLNAILDSLKTKAEAISTPATPTA